MKSTTFSRYSFMLIIFLLSIQISFAQQIITPTPTNTPTAKLTEEAALRFAETYQQPIGINAYRLYDNFIELAYDDNRETLDGWNNQLLEIVTKQRESDYYEYLKYKLEGSEDGNIGLLRWLEDTEQVDEWNKNIVDILGEDGYALLVALLTSFDPQSEEFIFTFGGRRLSDIRDGTSNTILFGENEFETIPQDQWYFMIDPSSSLEELNRSLLVYSHHLRTMIFEFYEGYYNQRYSEKEIILFNQAFVLAGGCPITSGPLSNEKVALRYAHSLNHFISILEQLGIKVPFERSTPTPTPSNTPTATPTPRMPSTITPTYVIKTTTPTPVPPDVTPTERSIELTPIIEFPTATPTEIMDKCIVFNDLFSQPGMADGSISVSFDGAEVLFEPAIREDNSIIPFYIRDCAATNEYGLYITNSPEGAFQKAQIIFTESVCDGAGVNSVQIRFTYPGLGSNQNQGFIAYDAQGEIVDVEVAEPSPGDSFTSTRIMKTVVLNSNQSSGITKIEITGRDICIIDVCWVCNEIEEQPTETPTPIVTPTLTPTIDFTRETEGCTNFADFDSDVIQLVELVESGMVGIFAAREEDQQAIPFQIIDCSGDGIPDVFIPITPVDIAQPVRIQLSHNICNGMPPQYVEITYQGDGSRFYAYDDDNTLVHTISSSDGIPSSDFPGSKRARFYNPNGIRYIEMVGSAVCITRICWQCDLGNVTPTPTDVPPTRRPTLTPTPTERPQQLGIDRVIITQGFGGDTFVNVRNFDESVAPLTSILKSYVGIGGGFLSGIGGGIGRTTYTSTGDVDGDGDADFVLSFGPITNNADFPNVVVPRNVETGQVVGHSFEAFKPGEGLDVNHNSGEVFTAVGNFIGSDRAQIAAAQGFGGNGVVRIFQYNGNPPPHGWEVVGQFYGLSENAQKANANGGITLAAGDLDNDGKDELLVGQTNSRTSQTIFHLLDIDENGRVVSRLPYAGFIPRFRGNGGVQLTVVDLNGDGQNEIVASSMGNDRSNGDERDAAPINVISIIEVIVENNQVVGFKRPERNVLSVFSEEMNPSGAISVSAAELNGKPDGKELLVGTGALLDIDGFNLRPRLSAPESRYRIVKIGLNNSVVGNIENVIGGGRGLPAFLDVANPISGSINIGVIPNWDDIFIPRPTPTPTPPMTIHMADFKLEVDSYSTFTYGNGYKTITNATGVAWTSFDCSTSYLVPGLFLNVELMTKVFRIVDFVNNPNEEITETEARQFDSNVQTGDEMYLSLPKTWQFQEPLTANLVKDQFRLHDSILDILVKPKKGDVKLKFENLTIECDENGDWHVVDGIACYPSDPPVVPADHIELKTAGFTTLLSTLCISPNSATATAELEFPKSIISGEDCRPANIDLGEITITQTCQYYKELLNEPYGPWTIDKHFMEIYGPGLVADFSKTQQWAGWTGSPTLNNSWRGVHLLAGETVPATPNTTISNTGYLEALYTYPDSLVTGAGLDTVFTLADRFTFQTLQPFGYSVVIDTGRLIMDNSQVIDGEFKDGLISLPREAVVDSGNNTILASYESMLVQDDLDLYAQVEITQDLQWGELSQTNPAQFAYIAAGHTDAHFYLSGVFKPKYWPLVGDNFTQPFLFPTETALENQAMQGVTVLNLRDFVVLTPDTPNRDPIKFENARSWINVVSKGIHGQVDIFQDTNPNMQLGPIHEESYVGFDFNGNRVPFDSTLTFATRKEFLAQFKFVDSALYDSSAEGVVKLGGPTNAEVPYSDMNFTSTAHLVGADVDLTNPVTLDYWGLDLVPKPAASSAGVISFKTGQILLTAAGLREARHFSQPFWLTWGELLSSGQLGRMVFDFNSAGQEFDGFPFVMDAIGLSPFDPANPDPFQAFLQVGGTGHFDFFGSNYFNIKDFNNPGTGAPFDGRRIELAFDNMFGTMPTDRNINRSWNGSFGFFDYDLEYDHADQDGFVGFGTATLAYIEDAITSSVVIDRDRICMTISTVGNPAERHDFTAGPVAHFGQMARITGCACVEDGQVKRIHLAAELESAANVNVFIRSAAYTVVEYDITPSTSSLFLHGNMYLSLIAGFDMELTGSARFTIDRDQEFVEGELDGKIETTNLKADGRLEWHLGYGGGDPYQSLQGKLGLQIISPVGGSGVEGGFYLGINAPKDRAWVLAAAGNKYSLNLSPMPDRLTGFYGYLKAKKSVNLYIVSGGIEVFVGLGAFVDLGGLPGEVSGLPGLPFVVGNVGVHIWGEILGGLVSAGAWGNLQIIAPYPFGFEGTVGLEGCVLWVFCGTVDVSVGLNSQDGFYVK